MTIARVLDRLYLLCGYLSAFFLAMIAVLTLAQIICRQLAFPLETSELSGFCLAASTFFGLSHTLVKGEHVRVSLFEGLSSAALRRTLEMWCCAIGALVAAFATYNVALFARDSHTFGDLSPGLMAVPMWIPQGTLVLGLGMLTIAFLHQLVRLMAGRMPQYLDKTTVLED
ncbi:MAG TPA: TRAP transporter small permease [Paenirhodobacter sp.]